MLSRAQWIAGVVAGTVVVAGAVAAWVVLRRGGGGDQVIAGDPSARAIRNLPSIPAKDDGPGVLEQSPRYAIPLSTKRLSVQVAEDATLGQLNEALSKVGAKVIASAACIEVTCNDTGTKVIVDDPKQVVRCGSASISGFSNTLGRLEIEVDDVYGASETLWDHPAIRSVSHRAERGTVMTRLPCAEDLAVSLCKTSVYRDVPSGPFVADSFGRSEKGVAMSTFNREAKVSDVNAALRKHDVLILGALGVGIYTLRLSDREDALDSLRKEAVVESASPNSAIEPDGDPTDGGVEPKPKVQQPKSSSPFSTRPVPCSDEPEMNEEGHRIISADVTVHGTAYVHRAFIAHTATDRERWPASLNVGDKVRSGRTQIGFAACWGVPGSVRLERIEEGKGTTKVVLETFEKGVKLGGDAPGLVVELPGKHDRVVFEDANGRPLAIAPEGPPPAKLDERRRPKRATGPRRHKGDLLGVGKTRDRSHGVWIVTDQDMLVLYWGTLSVDGSSPPKVNFSSGAVALMTLPASFRFYDATVILGACEEPTISIMGTAHDDPPEEGTLVAVQLLGSPARVTLIGGSRGNDTLAEGAWGAPGPTR